MRFPAWGLHVPEWAAPRTEESPARGPRAEWEGTADPAQAPSACLQHRALLLPLSLLPHLFLPWSGARRMGTAFAAATNFQRAAQEKEMREKRPGPRVALSTGAT